MTILKFPSTSQNFSFSYKCTDNRLTTRSRLKENRRYLIHRIPAFRSVVCILIDFPFLNNALALFRKSDKICTTSTPISYLLTKL